MVHDNLHQLCAGTKGSHHSMPKLKMLNFERYMQATIHTYTDDFCINSYLNFRCTTHLFVGKEDGHYQILKYTRCVLATCSHVVEADVKTRHGTGSLPHYR